MRGGAHQPVSTEQLATLILLAGAGAARKLRDPRSHPNPNPWKLLESRPAPPWTRSPHPR
uniref:Uncharacterized protein n=1 Tax=Oryza brachyantha TaxID=4533 RepID=J3N555_ORYBR